MTSQSIIPRQGNDINWRKVPRQALIDALRNASNIGSGANLSRTDKETLVRYAYQTLNSQWKATFLDNLATEIEYRRGAK